MYFIQDANYIPPYNPIPARNYTYGAGLTYYDMNYKGKKKFN